MTKALDAVILDVGLPDRSGLEVARELRRDAHPAGILMLTARDSIADRIAGLDAGADDYLVKPFYIRGTRRAAARSRAATAHPEAWRPGVACPWAPSCSTRSVTRSRSMTSPISLTAQEFAVLETLMRQAGRAMSRDELMDRAWPLGSELTQNAVEAYMHRLREKLGPAGEQIETVRGIGYRLRDR